ncbi:WcaF family extracellular polysaccharide biosynthesis acetyltransferase [Grimontia hollisae]|uniref:WcaF family extracellular polysaccharide biosynthesis acetyltransferase n=1 Tax=Grimontia hollisae TaxID=673 RepID=UPI0012AC9C52|nr:WcaF family extracellular polysaccharide biosynthesis acetyltransferase [Grimontia hollisae]
MSNVDLRNYDNSWFETASKVKILAWIFISAIFFRTSIPYPSAFKRIILRSFGAKIGSQVVIKPNVTIKYPWLLDIGDNSWLGENVWIDNLVMVSIGKNCCISQGGMLLTGNHNFKKTNFDLIVRPININDGAWVGAKAIVCPGVKMGVDSMLCVGSVASKDLNSNVIYQGNPAVEIKKRFVECKKH